MKKYILSILLVPLVALTLLTGATISIQPNVVNAESSNAPCLSGHIRLNDGENDVCEPCPARSQQISNTCVDSRDDTVCPDGYTKSGNDCKVSVKSGSRTGDSSKQCGKGDSVYYPTIDLGCQGESYKKNNPDAQLNPIMDMLFSFLRFLTAGVGLVAIASLVVAGIQYTTSRGDPAGTAKAIGRIASTIGALLLYILAWALLNWLVPGGIFNG